MIPNTTKPDPTQFQTQPNPALPYLTTAITKPGPSRSQTQPDPKTTMWVICGWNPALCYSCGYPCGCSCGCSCGIQNIHLSGSYVTTKLTSELLGLMIIHQILHHLDTLAHRPIHNHIWPGSQCYLSHSYCDLQLPANYQVDSTHAT